MSTAGSAPDPRQQRCCSPATTPSAKNCRVDDSVGEHRYRDVARGHHGAQPETPPGTSLSHQATRRPLLTASRLDSETAGNQRGCLVTRRTESAATSAFCLVKAGVRIPLAPQRLFRSRFSRRDSVAFEPSPENRDARDPEIRCARDSQRPLRRAQARHSSPPARQSLESCGVRRQAG
jgi:hypothetical protein